MSGLCIVCDRQASTLRSVDAWLRSTLGRTSTDMPPPPEPPGGWAAYVASCVQQGADVVAPVGQFAGTVEGVRMSMSVCLSVSVHARRGM